MAVCTIYLQVKAYLQARHLLAFCLHALHSCCKAHISQCTSGLPAPCSAALFASILGRAIYVTVHLGFGPAEFSII